MTASILWLAGRLVGSVGASILQKSILSAGIGVGTLWLVTYGILMLPGALIFVFFAPPPGDGFWTVVVLAAAFDVAGNVAMTSALRITDLSVFGPLNALRPILAGLAGWIFLDEIPTPAGFAGVLVLTVGAAVLLKPSARLAPLDPTRSHLRPVAWRLLGLALSTVAAMLLKRATLNSSPEGTLGIRVIAGTVCLLAAFGGIPRLRRSLAGPIPVEERRLLLIHAPVFFAMQWLTLKVFQNTLLTYSFAFFQLGMILQVLAGRWIFREPDFRRRLAACAVMCLGAMFVLLAG